MTIPLIQVDAFTDKPFSGNPAAVCLLSRPRPDVWMQAVAAEMNLSETAFIWPVADQFSLRWFTPSTEVDLCGHATIASAHAMWTENHATNHAPIRFQTRSGLLTATQNRDQIELDFPSTPAAPCDANDQLIESLGIEPTFVGKTTFDSFLVVDSEETVRSIQPDFRKLSDIETRGVIVTSKSTSPDYDFVSRFFAPAAGIDEDPVTGSAHCCLAPYWSGILGKTVMTGYQASLRGGIVHVKQKGDRVILAGQAVTVLRGELNA